MIQIQVISDNAVRVTPLGKLRAEDFRRIAPEIDAVIAQYGKIRLLIDASGFGGWENLAGFEYHAGFVKSHMQKVERIAVITAHDWQQWLVGAVRLFVHPDIKAYDKRQEGQAIAWILE
jgi:hypothetical protein